MSNTRGIRAGRAYVEIGTNNTALERGLKRASARLKTFGTGLMSIGLRVGAAGASMLAPLLATLKSASDMEEAMGKFGDSNKSGEIAQELSQMLKGGQK